MARRHDQKLKLKLNIWRSEGKLWFADSAQLAVAIENSGFSETEIKKRMGAGSGHLESARLGKGLTIWEANHLEWGLIPDDRNWTDRLPKR